MADRLNAIFALGSALAEAVLIAVVVMWLWRLGIAWIERRGERQRLEAKRRLREVIADAERRRADLREKDRARQHAAYLSKRRANQEAIDAWKGRR